MPELPLQLAVLELRFPGDPEVEVARGRFYQKIRAEFPEVYVPIPEPGQAPALAAYQFAVDDGARIVAIALNSFAYAVRGGAYKSFETFFHTFRRHFDSFKEEYRFLPGLTHIGLRYINGLPLGRDVTGMIMSSPLRLPRLSPGPQRNIAFASESLEGHGLLRVYVNTSGPDPITPNTQLAPDKAILDFDFSFVGSVRQPIPLDGLDAYTREAHGVIKAWFRNLVDSKYLEEAGVS